MFAVGKVTVTWQVNKLNVNYIHCICHNYYVNNNQNSLEGLKSYIIYGAIHIRQSLLLRYQIHSDSVVNISHNLHYIPISYQLMYIQFKAFSKIKVKLYTNKKLYQNCCPIPKLSKAMPKNIKCMMLWSCKIHV